MEALALKLVYGTNIEQNNQVFSPFKGNLDFTSIDAFEKTQDINSQFEDILKKQGPVEKAWDTMKNLFHNKNGSNAVRAKLEQYKNGEISKDEADEIFKKYVKGQVKSLEFISDCASTLMGGVFYGVSRKFLPNKESYVYLSMVLSSLGGALSKIGIKAFDAKAADREYTTGRYDFLTGLINGAVCPIADGVANKTVKEIGKKAGIDMTEEASLALKGEKLTEILTCPKQKINGNKLQKMGLFGIWKLIKGTSKFGIALLMRESVYKTYSPQTFQNSLMGRATYLLPDDAKENLLDKLTQTNEPPKNDVYGIEQD